MATHSSILAWRIPCSEEPSGLQSMGPQIVRHYRSDLTHTCVNKWGDHINSKRFWILLYSHARIFYIVELTICLFLC